MTEESEKYKKVLSILKKSKPELTGIEFIEQNVISRIRRKSERGRFEVLRLVCMDLYRVGQKEHGYCLGITGSVFCLPADNDP
jgi:hypothetical protein